MSKNDEAKVVEEIKETVEDAAEAVADKAEEVKDAAEEACACCSDEECCDDVCADDSKCPFSGIKPKCELTQKQKAIAIGAAAGLLALGAAAVALVFFYRNKNGN